ncbi:MAG: calcium/sodium antiporter [Candidatus Altimarinota bacterium]
MLIYILFIIGFFVLIKGADLLVSGASSIALKFKISPLVIGLTIVAFGTSAPEFAVNIFSATKGETELAIGNILGSNIANILLILGITSIIYPVQAKLSTVWKEIPFALLGAIMLGILANDKLIDGSITSEISRIDGLVLIGFFIIFLYYTFGISKDAGDTTSQEEDMKEISVGKSVLYIIIGLTGLILGGKWIVDGAVSLATAFGMSKSVIGLTVVAIGTSLPELATSVVAAMKKQSDIAIGNIVGSNIFNIFWILGFTGTLTNIPFSASSNIDILMTIFASILLFIFMFLGKKHRIGRWEGIIMVCIYIGYLAYLVLNI